MKKNIWNEVLCSKCGSSLVIISSTTYPTSFECKRCGNLFLKIPKALVDE